MPFEAEEMDNEQIAATLDSIAELLATQDANPFRVQAYRDAAQTVRSLDRSAEEVVAEGGGDALEELPNIGENLASVIVEMVHTGQSGMLQQLMAEVSPEAVFEKLPGIGKELAHRIVTQLDVDSLAELEMAAHDGRLQQVKGIGPERERALRLSLAGLLSRSAQRRRQEAQEGREQPIGQPEVGLLLAVDALYRQRAEAGELPTIAPRRFNPENAAWLPMLEDFACEGWTFTALYSNTKRAHELEKTHDWVVIYYRREGTSEDQVTVVTASQGPHQGQRVVRGRELDTRTFYAEHPSPDPERCRRS